MPDDLRDRILASYPAVLIRRFFDLELLDRSFGLAAQAFVAILPLVIVVMSVLFSDGGEVIASSISDRFGLAGAARNAITALFTSSDQQRTIYWVAILHLRVLALAPAVARVRVDLRRPPPATNADLARPHLDRRAGRSAGRCIVVARSAQRGGILADVAVDHGAAHCVVRR